MSKERPIIFSAPMVRAILSGRKSMTRRQVQHWRLCLEWSQLSRDKIPLEKCPYGVPGDRLWVREAWDFLPDGKNSANIFYWVDGDFQPRKPPPEYNPFLYNNPRKRPSIHMPRWASRISLEIVSVRVERLQKISEKDPKAEGAERMALDDLGNSWHTRRRGFQALWQSIHGPGSWEQNPWVWVLEFKRIQP